MSEHLGQDRGPNLPIVASEHNLSQIPFNLQWLQATDPRIFTPYGWKNGRNGRIDFTSSDGNRAVHVERYIARYIDGGARLKDEMHEPNNYDEVSGIGFEFDESGTLIESHVNYDDHMKRMLEIITQLVHDKGATIEAKIGFTITDSYFESDGEQWIDMMASQPHTPNLAAIEVDPQLLETLHQNELGN